jgi:hypothetical protein
MKKQGGALVRSVLGMDHRLSHSNQPEGLRALTGNLLRVSQSPPER